MHLVSFIIRIYHDARSRERQISEYILPLPPKPSWKAQVQIHPYLATTTVNDVHNQVLTRQVTYV